MDSPYLSSHGSPASPRLYRTAGSSPQQAFSNAFSQAQPQNFLNAFHNAQQHHNNHQQQGQSSASQGTLQGIPKSGPAALDYASAQLSNYAAAQQNMYNGSPSTPGGSNANASSPNAMGSFPPQLSQLPPGMDFSSMTLHSANSSAPASAASSPGWTHRRLPSSSSSQQQSTHTHNPRIAASAVTGKRLNWGEMICATIYHSEHGRLVIQDLFEQMCKRFPEVQEW
ncbi:hypothetical protein BDZ90DRAFT_50676 [Jaminaea rosea]|uniref:Fork-head domain-containing protein n=1 Tax=Jaminaea rosea TaxID=1569628 RepID=A0A316UM04_9BASI|nr:hypothetical protein BDZ90DRAFT_50676 [Jaminaea rosea]PWN26270.1 hypothetical protein BDZ90DRAFT_50676 [Jaminaea rosea]